MNIKELTETIKKEFEKMWWLIDNPENDGEFNIEKERNLSFLLSSLQTTWNECLEEVEKNAIKNAVFIFTSYGDEKTLMISCDGLSDIIKFLKR